MATCLVNYKGNRLICQSIIPGILNVVRKHYHEEPDHEHYLIILEDEGQPLVELLITNAFKSEDRTILTSVEIFNFDECKYWRNTFNGISSRF